MNYFISYDISKNRYRNRAAKILLRHGAVRVQKSVFFLDEAPPGLVRQLSDELKELLCDTGDDDSVLLIQVEQDWLDRVNMVGRNEAFEEARKKHITRFF